MVPTEEARGCQLNALAAVEPLLIRAEARASSFRIFGLATTQRKTTFVLGPHRPILCVVDASEHRASKILSKIGALDGPVRAADNIC